MNHATNFTKTWNNPNQAESREKKNKNACFGLFRLDSERFSGWFGVGSG